MSDGQKNTRLMKRMGSKTGRSDPEPPDQWLYVLRRGKCQTDKAVAWIKSKTIAYRHHSPYCVDEHGKALYLESMAVELDWKPQTARNVLNELEGEGRARVDEDRRIWLCADVPAAYERLESDTDIPKSNSDQSYFSGYLLDSVKQLPAKERAEAEAKYGAFLDWHDRIWSDGLAVLRAILDQAENNTLESIGLKKKQGKKKERAAPPAVELKLVVPFNSDQSYAAASNGNSDQSVDSSLINAKGNSDQAAPPLSASHTDTDPMPVSQSVSSGKLTDRPSKGQLEEIRELLTRRLGRKLKETPSDDLCSRVFGRLAGAPLIDLDARISLRWNAITSMGMAELLAKDVGNVHAGLERLRISDELRYQEQQEKNHQAFLNDIRARWDSLSQEDKEWYQEHVPEAARASGEGSHA